MTGEGIPEQPEDASAYIPTFNLDQMSVEDVLALNVALWAAYEATDNFDEMKRHSAVLEAFSADVGHYPSVNFDRGMELFEALSGSENDNHHFRAASAIVGLLRAAEGRSEDEQRKARKLWRSLLLHDDPDTQCTTNAVTYEAIENQRLKPETVATLFKIVIGELP